MKRGLLSQLALVLALATVGIAVVWVLSSRPIPPRDLPALNDAIRTTEKAWPQVASARLDSGVTVTGLDGGVLTTTALDPPANALEAAAGRAMTAPVVVEGAVVAMVHVADGTAAADARARSSMLMTATTVILVLALLTGALLLWLDMRILRPFRSLEKFAGDVASGDLDAPLDMDRRNAFGAWTESFDLMRNELAAARQQEAAAKRSKQQLVAQIGHDVRTPIASISATAELLHSQTTDPTAEERLDVILAKAEQIRALLTDLAQANISSATELSVRPGEFPAEDLRVLIREADAPGRAAVGPIPPCLLAGDRRRLAQVIDNVMNNAEKYAGTRVRIDAHLSGGPMLEVTFADAGAGLPERELGTIFGLGVRGSNAMSVPGEGLGLHTSAQLMERMGGAISARNGESGGLEVTVSIPLAGAETGFGAPVGES
ncbi:MAG: HAMP domain-containing sensor histidine kinase [Actinomycetia bacterium]|nr:HAMP domain-containing sensor histidine kinase [Actinomycetes bacterium]